VKQNVGISILVGHKGVEISTHYWTSQ